MDKRLKSAIGRTVEEVAKAVLRNGWHLQLATDCTAKKDYNDKRRVNVETKNGRITKIELG